jgi:NAD(P)H-dependent flavin oxidoreductase YrpB (nitropropane dioxygenase family)
MLHTYLTTSWHLRYPIIGAPMAYVGRGRLAHAVSHTRRRVGHDWHWQHGVG